MKYSPILYVIHYLYYWTFIFFFIDFGVRITIAGFITLTINRMSSPFFFWPLSGLLSSFLSDLFNK